MQSEDELPRVVRVLLIEDNPEVAELITEGLERISQRELRGRLAFVFDVVGDGQLALERLETIDPDLVVADVFMPVLDGLSFIQQLRARPNQMHKPVIALSAGGAAAREAALLAGADVFFDKPLRLQEVLAAVVRMLG